MGKRFVGSNELACGCCPSDCGNGWICCPVSLWEQTPDSFRSKKPSDADIEKHNNAMTSYFGGK